MKKCAALILTVILLVSLLSGCGVIVDNVDPKVIAVVVKGENTPFWNAVLAGAEDAASERGYAITFRGPGYGGAEGVKAQRDMIGLALENQAVAMVFQGVGEGFEDLMRVFDEEKKPVVQLASGIAPRDYDILKREKQNPVVASVYTNNKKAAAVAAENVFDYIKGDISRCLLPYDIGIIQHDVTANGKERTEGFIQKFRELAENDPTTAGKYEFIVETCVGDRNLSYARAMKRLQSKGVRTVFMTSGGVVDQVADLIAESGSQYDYINFAGFDSGRKQVDWLRREEGPKLIGSVTQDPYTLGYKCIEQCVNAMEALGVTAFVSVPGAWYDRSNLDLMVARNMIDEG